MNQKIIFFDIDGTILSHRDHQISSSTKNAIRKARANGHLTFINTGRTFSELDDKIKGIGFDGFVCGCGTYINYNSEVLLHTEIDPVTQSVIIKDLRELKINAVLEGTGAIYFDTKLNNPKLMKIKEMYEKLGFQILNWESSEISFDKFCVWLDSPEAVQHFKNKYEDRYDFIYRDELFFEVVPKGYSKATGIQYLLSYLDIPFENAYALGDGANDLTMLQYVKHSIGMGNSEELIKNIVSFLTKDVDECGVEHALRHFAII